MFFDVKSANSGIRTGIIAINGTTVNTPVFMPVGTRASVKGLTNEQVLTTGASIVLGNTYHLHLNPGEKVIKQAGGLHSFTRWNKLMLTDSGGFQVFSLGKMRKITDEGVEFNNSQNGDKLFMTPEDSIRIQHDIGADIIMAFDDVVDLKNDRPRQEEAMQRTHEWLLRCVDEHKRLSRKKTNSPKLFGIIQGGMDKKLRKTSLEFIQQQDVDGIAIGGLSVGEPTKHMHSMLEYLEPMYDPVRPHYLMGVGHPRDIRFAIEHGIDMFDCVLPTRNARHGTVWVEGDKQINLKSARFSHDQSTLDESCDCQTCVTGYSKAYLRHLIKVGEFTGGTLLSIHNLRYLQRICELYQKQ